MRPFSFFFLIIFSLHVLILFYIQVQKPIQKSSHKVLLVSSQSYKVTKPKTSKVQDTQNTNEAEQFSESLSEASLSDTPINPEYPRISRLKGEEGENLIRFKIDAQGKANDINIDQSSGFARLDQASLKAIQAAQFHVNTKPELWFELRFKFTLN